MLVSTSSSCKLCWMYLLFLPRNLTKEFFHFYVLAECCDRSEFGWNEKIWIQLSLFLQMKQFSGTSNKTKRNLDLEHDGSMKRGKLQGHHTPVRMLTNPKPKSPPFPTPQILQSVRAAKRGGCGSCCCDCAVVAWRCCAAAWTRGFPFELRCGLAKGPSILFLDAKGLL
jgi:hypothetical protein